MIDRLYINGIDVQERFGFWLRWRNISMPTIKSNYKSIAGADAAVDLTEANGRVFYNQRTIELSMMHPERDYHDDLDGLSALHGDKLKISFASDPTRYFIGRLIVGAYDSKTRKLSMSGDVFPYRFEKLETVYTVKNSRTIMLVNDAMPVTPKVEVTGTATLAWKEYTQALGEGTYYIDGLELGKHEVLPVEVTLGSDSSVKISYRKGRI